jgi:hypothetical protein
VLVRMSREWCAGAHAKLCRHPVGWGHLGHPDEQDKGCLVSQHPNPSNTTSTYLDKLHDLLCIPSASL